MKKRIAAVAIAGLTLFSSASQGQDISFNKEIVPLLNQYCVVCHMSGGEQGKLSLYPDAYASLVNKASSESPLLLVKPGSAAKSYLFHKLTGTQGAVGGSGKPMPYDQGPLEAAQIEKIRLWIKEGAKQN